MHKIIICGGHLSPALAVIESLGKEKDYKIYYFGRKNALEGDRGLSLEYLTISKLGIPFKIITTARFQRSFTIFTIPSFLKFPVGVFQSIILLLRIKPELVLSFGGYVALPVALAAVCLHIPIITHEQTHNLGLTNKIICRYAKILCLSFKDTAGLSANITTQLTGNPIRKSIFAKDDAEIVNFGDKSLPLIFITGGSLGSKSINRIIAKIIERLCIKYRILHQTGSANNEADYRYLTRLKNALPPKLRENYYLAKQIEPSSFGSVLGKAGLVIGRAGANTVNEILAFGTVAVLIPLPWAGQNEQEKNAVFVKELGLGEVILQKQLTPQYLSETIDKIFANLDFYKKKAQKAKTVLKKDAASEIVKLIKSYCA